MLMLTMTQAGIARDFSFMTQSFGMTAAAFTILMMQIRVEWYSILYTTMGGVPGTSRNYFEARVWRDYTKGLWIVHDVRDRSRRGSQLYAWCKPHLGV
jgi:hypothetical protein